MTSTEAPSVGVVGAGLVGCLAALAFRARGYDVSLFELRDDPKDLKVRNLKSINLAVSDRGLRALKKVDPALAERVLDNVIPMHGRMIHGRNGRQESQTYGLFGESINSIDRSFLNQILIEELKLQEVNVRFRHKLIKIETTEATPELTFLNTDTFATETFDFDYIVGADGAHSQFRYQLQRHNRMDFSQKYIDMQYLELYIPPKADGGFAIDAHHLHIWPRNNFMLIALPNKDGSFTSTFFSPWLVIEELQDAEAFVAFFRTHFPDAVDLLGEEQLKNSFQNLPRGSLMQVSAYPYHSSDGRALIIGDAAHSMVPFYGQGMNCGFEDVSVILELLEKNLGDLTKTFCEYSEARKNDVDTICKLAWDNYFEMSSKVTQKSYLLRKKLDYYLGKYANGRFFQWIPMYTMISFRGDISYSKAVEIEQKQTRFVHGLQNTVLVLTAAAAAATAWHRLSRR